MLRVRSDEWVRCAVDGAGAEERIDGGDACEVVSWLGLVVVVVGHRELDGERVRRIAARDNDVERVAALGGWDRCDRPAQLDEFLAGPGCGRRRAASCDPVCRVLERRLDGDVVFQRQLEGLDGIVYCRAG